MEKATWFDASLDSANGYRNIAWYTAGLNPTMFHPSFAMFMNCPSKSAVTSVSVSLSITYYFAFRNPRFGGTGTSSKVVDLGSRPLPDLDDDAGDMDGDDGDAFADPFARGAAAPSMDVNDEDTLMDDTSISSREAASSVRRMRANLASRVGASRASTDPGPLLRQPKNVQ